MVNDRAFIFHVYIPWGKALSLVLKSRSSVKVKYQGHSFRKNGCSGAFVFKNTSCSSLGSLEFEKHFLLLTVVQVFLSKFPCSLTWLRIVNF